MADINKAFAIAVCDELGIPASMVRSITIKLDAGGATIIDVRIIPEAFSQRLHDALSELRKDGAIVNVNWNRPIYDVTNMTSEAVEVGE